MRLERYRLVLYHELIGIEEESTKKIKLDDPLTIEYNYEFGSAVPINSVVRMMTDRLQTMVGEKGDE